MSLSLRNCCTRFWIGSVATALLLSGQSVLKADYRAAVLADGPIGYWTLDEGDGIATNLGTLGDEADGEYFGDDREVDAGPDLPGMSPGNQAMRLTLETNDEATLIDDASGVTVETPILDDLQAFTLSGWINPLEADLSNRAGLFGQDNAIEFGFIGPNNIHFWAELPEGGSVNSNALYDYDNDEWHHIALTGDGETGDLFFYVDGEEIDGDATNSVPLEELEKDSYGISGLPFQIGGGAIFGADRQYAGGLDEIAAFDKYLTEEQIQAHYQAALEGTVGDPCDFDGSGSLDVGDINLLSAAIAGGETDAKWDVNKDGAVNVGDLDSLVTDSSKLNTYIGDANLNGEFNSGDLVVVFSAGEYEDGVAGNSTWGTGDWNADLEFGSGDLVAAFTDGGYEQGPKAAAVAVVPEPSSFVLLTIAGLLILRRRRVS